MRHLFYIVLFLIYFDTTAQILSNDHLVQFSGVIVTIDSLKPIPYSSVMIKNSNRGTISDYYGFFSFVAKMKDTIEFAAIGFKKGIFVIPDTLTDQRCSMIQVLKQDTIMLREVMIFPWPTKEQFKEAFLHLRVPEDDLTRAERNLEEERLNYLAANLPMDGSMNFKNMINEHTTQLYYSGQLRPNTLLDPIKWAKFIQMWQNGAFKEKENKYKD